MSAQIIFQDTKVKLPHVSKALTVTGEIQKGEVIALRGPSGCGKSSTLNALALMEDSKPIYLIAGESTSDIDPWKLSCGYDFQDTALLDHLNVIDNLCFPLKFRTPFKDWDLSLQRDRAMQYLRNLDLDHLSESLPCELSGGEAQRVGLLRACIYEPKLLLLDETFSALDKETKKRVKIWLKSHIQHTQSSCLLIAHSDEDGVDFVDREITWPTSSNLVLQF